jgi:pimeloyl-ACP methyl ester carboxylesterase
VKDGGMKVEKESLGGLDIRVWSAGSGAPLLYLHGFEQHPGAAAFLTRLARNHDVRAPEHPGYGESTSIEENYDVIDVALHYRRMIESWNRGPVDVVGHSLGGMFAAELAALSPHLVRRLVLVDAYGLWLDDHPMPDPFAMAPKELDRAKWFDPNKAPMPEPSAFDAHGDADALAIFRAQNLGTATKFMWPVPDRGLRRRLPYVQAPTLIIHGEADGLIPAAYAEAFARLIPKARVAMIRKAGHLPMIEAEDEFISTVNDFLG